MHLVLPNETKVKDLSFDEVQKALNYLISKHGFIRPTRSDISESDPRQWLRGVPNYDVADLSFFLGRSQVHSEGSLEFIVENAVKAWEMEATHLPYASWNSVDHSCYNVSANGGEPIDGEEAAKMGNYNWLMQTVDPSVYDASQETFESSHAIFGNAFENGFPWEVLKVFSGPPEIAFSWRHWAYFTGVYKGKEGDGKRYDMYGLGLLTVNEELKVQKIRIFYDPKGFLEALEGKKNVTELHRAGGLVGSGCPFLQSIQRGKDNSEEQ